MTKEKILEVIERTFGRELHWEEKATNELFELIEQEKKEQAREIFERVQDDCITLDLKRIAKEYGVEL